MKKNKIKNEPKNTSFRPEIQKSELSDFVEHTLPGDEEVRRFDGYLRGNESKKNLNESLSKIYEGDDGKRINVQQLNIKKRRSLWMRLGIIALYAAIVAALAYGGYFWYMRHGGNKINMDLTITGPSELVANQQFTYTIVYQNKENLTLNNIDLNVAYPENFIFESSEPAVSAGNNDWKLPDLKPYETGRVTITGRLISRAGASNVLFADLNYGSQGITADFKKSASFDMIVSSSGLEISAVGPGTALIGQEQTISLNWKPEDTNFINTFTIRLQDMPNLELVGSQPYPEGITEKAPGVFEAQAKPLAKPFLLKFKIKEKTNNNETVKIFFEYQPVGSNKTLAFEEKDFPIEVISNSLNLTVAANGQTIDQGVNFGQAINYTISYSNKGEQSMNDVIVMAVIEGDAVDWRQLIDVHKGKVVGSTIVWTKAELPELAAISKGQSGTIEFTLPLRPANEAPLVRQYEVNSYAQFALSDHAEDLTSENSANRSNSLSLKVNSDLALEEAARYFDENNIAVGTGPLPPKVGETTTVKVYWKITNSLHELGELKVTTTLPAGVSFDGKNLANAGSIAYDSTTNQVTWTIGRFPLSVSSMNAEFSVAITPTASDRNKLMVLVSGTTLSARDNTTGFPISQVFKAQTTKLDKDDIADTDGIVR